jgi:predicted MPP superfamily phosphohydrolase
VRSNGHRDLRRNSTRSDPILHRVRSGYEHVFSSSQVSLPTLFAWWTASGAVWLVASNRVMSHFPDGIPKRLALVGALLALILAGTASAVVWRGWQGLIVPVAILAIIALGEIRGTALRRSYSASPPVSVSRAPASWWQPVTTTRLIARRYAIEVEGLPVPRLRVAQVSDLHVGGGLPVEYYRSAFDLAAAHEPDVVVVTGDFVSRDADLGPLGEVLGAVTPPRLGAFAILGNHDHWVSAERVRRIVEDAGFQLVHGRCHPLGLSADHDVFVGGDEQPWGPPLTSYPPSGVTLVLSHTPDNVYRHSRAGAVFAGHVHGGQFRLPGLGALAIPSRYGRRFDRGHFRVGNAHLFVSSGVGGIPLRLWCEPDILIVDLVAAPNPGWNNNQVVCRDKSTT